MISQVNFLQGCVMCNTFEKSYRHFINRLAFHSIQVFRHDTQNPPNKYKWGWEHLYCWDSFLNRIENLSPFSREPWIYSFIVRIFFLSTKNTFSSCSAKCYIKKMQYRKKSHESLIILKHESWKISVWSVE